MPRTNAEKAEIAKWARGKACNEFRRGEACEQRDAATQMIGGMHEGCLRVQQILELLEHA